MSAPTIGRIVIYTLTEADADLINGRRADYATPGNPAAAGDEYPAVVVRVWGPAASDPAVNLQVLLDGSDSYWATSRTEVSAIGPEGDRPGHWHWPLRG